MAKLFINRFYLGFLLWVSSVSSAYAYLDPGTGSLLLQCLLGGIAGIAVFLRVYWHALVSWFRGSKSYETNQEDH